MEFANFVPCVTNVWSAISSMLFVHQMTVCVKNLNIRVPRIKLSWENCASCSGEWDGVCSAGCAMSVQQGGTGWGLLICCSRPGSGIHLCCACSASWVCFCSVLQREVLKCLRDAIQWKRSNKWRNNCVLHHTSTLCVSCGAVVFGEEANSSNPPAPICSRSHSLRFLVLLVCKIGSKVMVLFFVMSSLTVGTVR
jgi:hypothetical protein